MEKKRGGLIYFIHWWLHTKSASCCICIYMGWNSIFKYKKNLISICKTRSCIGTPKSSKRPWAAAGDSCQRELPTRQKEKDVFPSALYSDLTRVCECWGKTGCKKYVLSWHFVSLIWYNNKKTACIIMYNNIEKVDFKWLNIDPRPILPMVCYREYWLYVKGCILQIVKSIKAVPFWK